MNQTYNQLSKQIDSFNILHKNNDLYQKSQIQKIYSTPHYLILRVRFPGQNRYIYLGRGAEYTGLWVQEKGVPPELRIDADKYLMYARRVLVNQNIQEIVVDPNDRAVVLSYFSSNESGRFGLFWKGRQLYFYNLLEDKATGKTNLLCSWRGVVEEFTSGINNKESKFHLFDEVGRKQESNFSFNFTDTFFDPEKYANEIMQKIKNLGQEKKRHKSLDRKIHNIESDIKKISSWRYIRQQLESDSIDLEDIVEIELGNKKYKLNIFDNKYKKIDFIYNKIKKLAEVEKQLIDRRNVALLEKENLLKHGKASFNLNLINTSRPVWVDPKKATISKKINKTEGYDTFVLNQKISGAVGKNAGGNDNLRSIFATKNDMWFHLDGHTGSHLILKMDRDLLNEQILRTVGSMLISYSGLNTSEANLIYTEVKNIKGIKKQKGAVTFKKAKYLKIFSDPGWKDYVLFK